MTIRLFLLSPTVVWRARVNMASITYPLDELQFDTETVGSYQDLEVEQTILLGSTEGADDLGRTRVRKDPIAGTLYVGRSSRGTRDGELDVSDDAYLTGINLMMPWTKVPFIDADGDIWTDSSLPVASRTTNPPPVANAGVPAFGTIDSGTSKLRVQLPHEANTSFAVADGASISSYAWELPSGVTLVTGYALTDSVIQVDCDPGSYYIKLTVTDSNANTHVAHCPVIARDPDADVCINAFQISQHRITPEGQRVSVRILEDIPVGTYPDGTLALIADGEPETPADRSNILFWGFHHTDPAEITAQRTGTLKNTTLELLDIAGKLDTLPGYPQEVQINASPTSWLEMTAPNVDKYLHFLIHWFSNALSLTDWTPSGTSSNFNFVILGSDGASLWDQVQRRCKALTPDYMLTCNTLGQLRVIVDPMLQDSGDRTSTNQFTMDESYWSDVRYTHIRPPRVHWLRSGAILTGSAEPIQTVFCIAPGDSPGQGESSRENNEALAQSQSDLNSCEGHRYARDNAPEGHYTWTLSRGSDHDIEPADMTWVRMTLTAATAAQRGLNFTNERGLVHALNIRYNHTRTGLVRLVEMEWERETEGTPAVTVVQDEAVTTPGDSDDFWPGDYWDQPAFHEVDTDPGELFTGSPKAYILWNSAHVMRTWDISVSSPVWELVDTGISGTIYDGQYVHVGGSQVGMWLMTSDAIWWCNDIMATTPVWDDVLTIATVRAAESGTPVFECMANYATEPGYLIVLTGPAGDVSTYPHAYSWHTHDYGANWTQVDMDNYLENGASPDIRGYYIACLYSMEIFRSAPGTIYAVRSCALYAGNDRVSVFTSSDLGDTWAQRYTFVNGFNFSYNHSLLHPFPSASDPSYVFYGAIGVTNRPDVYRSTNEWATGTVLTTDGNPTGYGGVSALWRPNKKTFETDHLMAWFRHSATEAMHLLDSNDQGATWNLVYNSGLADVPISAPQRSITNCARHNTPNGWPADENTWFLVRADGAIGAPVVAITEDYFNTVQSREGNLNTLLGGVWDGGCCNGVALPKIPPNV